MNDARWDAALALVALATFACGQNEEGNGGRRGSAGASSAGVSSGGDAGRGSGNAGGSGAVGGASTSGGVTGAGGENAAAGGSGAAAGGDVGAGGGLETGGDAGSIAAAGAGGAGAAGSGGIPPSDLPIDTDDEYANQTETFYLSGHGIDDAVDWEFTINTGRQAGVASTLPVPSNWEFHGFGTFQYGFNTSTEVGTYRRTFELPPSFAGKQVFLVFEGSMTDTLASINGMVAGPVHQGAFYRFKYDVTALLRSGSNDLEVAVSKQSANASVNAAEREADYWTFGGIFRPVYLEAYPTSSIERFAINARSDGALDVDVRLRNISEAARLTMRVLDANLAAVGTPASVDVAPNAASATLTGSFAGVLPWSAESPTRYRIALELETGGVGRHAVRENFGFRSVEVRAGDGIYVNGTRVVLKGTNRHSFWPDSGRALSAALSRADVEVLKDMNMNAVRNSHYPADKHFLDRADAAGLFVLDELAGWQAPPYDTETGRRLIEEMVTFNVNHPSILFWNNGNEGGWNTALDTEFAVWDPQARPVLHPWATFGNINTDHYESFSSTVSLLGGDTLFMPTEFLHGLYDGGAGAGLDDYWRATLQSPRGAGGLLGAFVDDGVRTAGETIDTAGNAAPDGILGPYREKEGSYDTIRQIWSPVQMVLAGLPQDFQGGLEIQNRYDATDLDQVSFAWKLVRFELGDPDGGHTVQAEGNARTGSIAPGARGTLMLPLPEGFRSAHTLLLDATDASGRLIGKWSWMLQTAAELRAGIVPGTSATTAVATDGGTTVTVTAAGTAYTFLKASGALTSVTAGGRTFPLRNGPTPSVGTATLASFASAPDGNDHTVTATYTGGMDEVAWRVMGNGWIRLSYRYSVSGTAPYLGVDFDCTEEEVTSVDWLGRGPSRVWKNRMRGPWHDLWRRTKNDAITGQRWLYPEFKGYFADVHFARIHSNAGTIDVVMDAPDLFLRLYTPTNGVSPQTASMAFPPGDISFLHGISPIGDKFLAAADLGPEGQLHTNPGTLSATLYFRFTPTPER
jgi:hypothetical protein